MITFFPNISHFINFTVVLYTTQNLLFCSFPKKKKKTSTDLLRSTSYVNNFCWISGNTYAVD